MLRLLFFDLDDTLYSPQTGLWPVIGERITLFIQERLGLPFEAAQALRRRYAQEYGVTLAGLRQHHAIDPDDYLEFVHRLPLENYLQPNPALNGMLARLPLPKAVLTNADAGHASRVLERLGITRHFRQIVDIRALGYINKPRPEAYQRAAELLSVAPAECVLIDDLPHNLPPARALGMVTILVRPLDGAAPPAGQSAGLLPAGVDYQTPDILGVERVLAGLIGQV